MQISHKCNVCEIIIISLVHKYKLCWLRFILKWLFDFNKPLFGVVIEKQYADYFGWDHWNNWTAGSPECWLRQQQYSITTSLEVNKHCVSLSQSTHHDSDVKQLQCHTAIAATLKVKRLKVSTFTYRHLQGNPGQQRFTIEVAYWLAVTQVAQRK